MPTCPGCGEMVAYDRLSVHERYCDRIGGADGVECQALERLEVRLAAIEERLDQRINRIESGIENRLASVEEREREAETGEAQRGSGRR